MRSLSEITAETVNVVHGRPLRAAYETARRASFGIKSHGGLVAFVVAAAKWEDAAIAYGRASLELASLSARVEPVSAAEWPETVTQRS